MSRAHRQRLRRLSNAQDWARALNRFITRCPSVLTEARAMLASQAPYHYDPARNAVATLADGIIRGLPQPRVSFSLNDKAKAAVWRGDVHVGV